MTKLARQRAIFAVLCSIWALTDYLVIWLHTVKADLFLAVAVVSHAFLVVGYLFYFCERRMK